MICEEHDAHAAFIAKKLAENLTLEMIKELKSSEIDDEKGLFQGQVCHMLAAFILSYSIKILQRNDMEELLDDLGVIWLEMAHDFAKHGKFTEIKEN